MCCATFIAKYSLFIANLLFSVLGLGIVSLGVALLVILQDFLEILPIDVIPITLIVLGCVVFIIGFLACCGAIRESRCMLICYSIIVGLLLIGFIYLSVLILGSLDTLQATVEGWVDDAFRNESLRSIFNALENAFTCCGSVGASSYLSQNQTIPASCCATPDAAGACAAAAAYGGCGDQLGSWMESFSSAIGGVLVVIIIVQSVAVILALFLSNSISRANKEMQMEKQRIY